MNKPAIATVLKMATAVKFRTLRANISEARNSIYKQPGAKVILRKLAALEGKKREIEKRIEDTTIRDFKKEIDRIDRVQKELEKEMAFAITPDEHKAVRGKIQKFIASL